MTDNASPITYEQAQKECSVILNDLIEKGALPYVWDKIKQLQDSQPIPEGLYAGDPYFISGYIKPLPDGKFEKLYNALTNPYEEVLSQYYSIIPALGGKLLSWLLENTVTIIEALEHAAELHGKTQDGWMPIDSAPKDGTWIFGYWPTMKIDDHPCAIYYDVGVYSNPNAWSTVRANDYGQDEVYPTHWAPLIAPPIQGETE